MVNCVKGVGRIDEEVRRFCFITAVEIRIDGPYYHIHVLVCTYCMYYNNLHPVYPSIKIDQT